MKTKNKDHLYIFHRTKVIISLLLYNIRQNHLIWCKLRHIFCSVQVLINMVFEKWASLKTMW